MLYNIAFPWLNRIFHFFLQVQYQVSHCMGNPHYFCKFDRTDGISETEIDFFFKAKLKHQYLFKSAT